MSLPRLTEILEKIFDSTNDRLAVDVEKSVALDITDKEARRLGEIKKIVDSVEVEQAGWISKKITDSDGGGVHTVKDSAGKVAMLLVEGAQDVTLRDDDTAIWAAVNNDSVDWSRCPLTAETSIKLLFGGETSAWIVYK